MEYLFFLFFASRLQMSQYEVLIGFSQLICRLLLHFICCSLFLVFLFYLTITFRAFCSVHLKNGQVFQSNLFFSIDFDGLPLYFLEKIWDVKNTQSLISRMSTFLFIFQYYFFATGFCFDHWDMLIIFISASLPLSVVWGSFTVIEGQ